MPNPCHVVHCIRMFGKHLNLNAMKNSSLSLLFFLCFATAAWSQNSIAYTGAAAMDLRTDETTGVGPMLGFESLLKKNTTIGVKSALLFSSTAYPRSVPGDWRLQETILVIQPGVKFYSKEPFRGFHFGIHGSYMVHNQKLEDRNSGTELSVNIKEINSSFFGAGIDFGFGTTVSNRIVFGIGAVGDLLLDVTPAEEGAISIGLEARVGYRF